MTETFKKNWINISRKGHFKKKKSSRYHSLIKFHSLSVEYFKPFCDETVDLIDCKPVEIVTSSSKASQIVNQSLNKLKLTWGCKNRNHCNTYYLPIV